MHTYTNHITQSGKLGLFLYLALGLFRCLYAQVQTLGIL
jgi:hypothetical protein